MPRRVYLLGLGLALVALALAFTDWLLTPPLSPGVTEANAKRIRVGMTLAEVEAIFGRPSNNHPGSVEVSLGSEPRRYRYFHWVGDEVRVSVIADEAGGAVLFSCSYRFRGAPPSPGPLARLRSWLGW
jgi:hypothetical protein